MVLEPRHSVGVAGSQGRGRQGSLPVNGQPGEAPSEPAVAMPGDLGDEIE